MVDIYEIYAHIRTHWFLDGLSVKASTRQFTARAMGESYNTPSQFTCDSDD